MARINLQNLGKSRKTRKMVFNQNKWKPRKDFEISCKSKRISGLCKI